MKLLTWLSPNKLAVKCSSWNRVDESVFLGAFNAKRMKTLDKNLPKELRHVARHGLADEFLRTVGQHASKLVGKSLYQSLEDNGVHHSLIEELVTGQVIPANLSHYFSDLSPLSPKRNYIS